MTIELVNYQMEDGGWKPALVKHGGRKWLHVLTQDYPMTVIKVEPRAEKYMRPMTRTLSTGTQPYPLKRAVYRFRNFGKKGSMTKSAKRFINEAIAQVRATPEQS